MKWRIDYSRDSLKFIEKQNAAVQVKKELQKFLTKMKSENINIDVRKLTGKLTGY